LKKYCIDYKNGGLGNSILAHVLFSAEKINFDLADFFSSEGHAHKIAQINNTELTAVHLEEFPNKNLICILHLVSQDWLEILRYKMSYCKWHKQEPTLDNWQTFSFTNYVKVDSKHAWQEFYQQVRDPSWPDCVDPQQIKYLPKHIQQEIHATWVEPKFSIDNQQKLVELLTLTYYDMMSTAHNVLPDSKVYYLDQYFREDFGVLQELCSWLGWSWNDSKSQAFFAKLMETNRQYFQWLERMQICHAQTLAKKSVAHHMAEWETAVILAKLCLDLNKHPDSLSWDSSDCIFQNNSVNLYKFLGL
jgi:hypothetical protein